MSIQARPTWVCRTKKWVQTRRKRRNQSNCYR